MPSAVPVLGVKLFGAIGVGEDGPRPFFAVVEYVGLGVHSFEFEEEVMRLLVSETNSGSSPSSGASSAMGGGRDGGGGALPLPF
eukprot:scaffold4147_cov114-Isochrysis_galbana.AAC.2